MAGNAAATIGERHAVVDVSGITGHWATLAGGGQTGPVTRVYNGGSPKAAAYIIPGRVVIADVVVTRPFSPARDAQVVKDLRTKVGKFVAKSITKSYVDLDGFVVGKAEVFTGCLLTGISAPNYDESSSNGAFVTLTFTPSAVA
jgi:hypothetical protein